jgi:16S rRNA (guanine527-N7)-methyltransferase
VTADPHPPVLPELVSALGDARRLGFFGPQPIAGQLEHAQSFVDALEAEGVGPTDFLDLGSGGGLPGLLFAARWTDRRATLLDASVRRTAFLRGTVEVLGWADRVAVAEGRAELLAKSPPLRGAFPLVIARSFAAPAVTAEIGGAFLEVGGVLAVSEPEDPSDRWPSDPLAQIGLRLLGIVAGANARVALISRTAPVEERWPRAIGIPTKRPLW